MAEEVATEYMNIRFTQPLRESVEQLAETERRPLSMMARILIEEALAARSKKAKKQ